MKTQELKEYINRTLGNNVRCLLPSYWWKRLFGLVVDKVDEIVNDTNEAIAIANKNIDKVKDTIQNKAEKVERVVLDPDTSELNPRGTNKIYTLNRYDDGGSLTVNAYFADADSGDLAFTLWVRGKSSLIINTGLNFPAAYVLRVSQNIDLSNLNYTSVYKIDVNQVQIASDVVLPVVAITEYSDNQSWYDAELSETSTNAVQSKAVKEYVDSAFSNVSIDIDSAMSETSENAVQNKVVKEYVDTAITQSITNTLNTAV